MPGDGSPVTITITGRLLTPAGPRDALIDVDGAHIRRVVTNPANLPHDLPRVSLPRDQQYVCGPGTLVVPGLIDIHCHGGGGASFSEGAACARTAAAYHHQRGTTSVMASLVSAPLPELITQIKALVALVHDGTLAGIHLEGPWLSARRRGAHHAEFLHDPDPGEVADLLAAGEGTLRMLTLAPERPGALQAIDMLVEKGVTVAIGHTDATAAQTRDALLHGAGVATHLFNGMRGLHHREGGPVLALAASANVFAELIADGHHLAADVLLACMSVLGRRAVLVSDAVAAAGCPDGRYRLGAQHVVMNAGEVRTEDGGSLAGSSLHLLNAVHLVTELGVSLDDAVHAATRAPAAAVGLYDRGQLLAGQAADLLVLGADLSLQRVMRRGVWQ
jgi:N-acetylglucosamine-6-phosphate deacetylase